MTELSLVTWGQIFTAGLTWHYSSEVSRLNMTSRLTCLLCCGTGRVEMQILSELFGSVRERSIKLQKVFQRLFWKKILSKPYIIMLWNGRKEHAFQGNSSNFMRWKFHVMLQTAAYSCMFLYCCKLVFGHPNLDELHIQPPFIYVRENMLQICMHYLSSLVWCCIFFQTQADNSDKSLQKCICETSP